MNRLRRLRRTQALRDLVRETRLHAANLILPLFVVSGEGRSEPVAGFPGVEHHSPDRAAARAAEADQAGVGAVLLFGVPDHKDAEGSAAWDDTGPVPEALRAIRASAPGLVLITDLCLCSYTSHGHCGVLAEDGTIANDLTLPILARVAVSHAKAGADLVGPSDMMDGRVAAIRAGLDEAGFTERVGILSYSSKFASAFYGPFRDAAHSAPASGDRRSYQLDFTNPREAIRESLIDEAEGADLLMVKPAGPYLDVITRLVEATNLPVVAYQVSGEHVMLRSAAAGGAFDLRSATLESLVAIRRAGATCIITYSALDAARWLR